MVDVIIPTYKPDQKFLKLMKMLKKQTVAINQIIIINTEEIYLKRLIDGTDFFQMYPNTIIFHQSKREFDHGKTRNLGASKSKSNFFVCMTQDAVPNNEYVLEQLLKALSQEKVAVAYARQLASDDSTEVEKFTRIFNYPATSVLKAASDLPDLGIKTFFCSNVCAAYDRAVFEKLGRFVNNTIFNEDMIFAGKAVKAGYKIAYVAEAQVIHSHHYSHKEQFRRNFDLGVSQYDNPQVFAGISSQSEGIKMVKLTAKHLKNTGNSRYILNMLIDSAYKLLGYKCGFHYSKIPKRLILRWTMNPQYWLNNI